MQSVMIKIGNFFFRYRNRAFPLVMIALFAIAVPPHQLFSSTQLEIVKDIVAMLVALSGLVLRGVVIGYKYIKRGGLNKQVYADTLVTEGMFQICRNPLYVGNILIYIGVFLMHGDVLVMTAGMLTFLFIYQCIVLAEEAFLRNKFGAAYDAYCAEVPRWIPKFSRFRKATEGMEFNFRRVIFKDYTTMATTVLTLALVEGYEFLALPGSDANRRYLMFIGGIILITGVWTLVVRYIKKRPDAVRA